jgi:recombination protein RecT
MENALTLLEQQKSEILQTLPASISPERWWQLAIQILKNPTLNRCTPVSLVESLRQIAAWGLELDNEEATIIPYGQQAQATAMMKGVVRRVIESGAAVHVYAEIIAEGEAIRISSGTTGRNIEHELSFGTRGKIIGAYAVAILPGGLTDFELFGQNDIEAIQRAALRVSGGKPSPAWQSFPGEMIKKSVLRRLCKRLRGTRDTDEAQRFNTLMDGMKRVEPEPTAPLTPDEMPKPAEPVAETPSAALVDEAQIAVIDDNAQSTGIPPKKYAKLMQEFGIAEECQLPSDQLPAFLRRMHELVEAN